MPLCILPRLSRTEGLGMIYELCFFTVGGFSMSHIVLEQPILAKLMAMGESVEIRDEAGNLRGYFSPTIDRELYDGLEPEISEEELQRREQRTGGRTLAEILHDLEKRT